MKAKEDRNALKEKIEVTAMDNKTLLKDEELEKASGGLKKGIVEVPDKTEATAALKVIDNALQRALNQEASIGATLPHDKQ